MHDPKYPSGAKTTIFRDNQVNGMAADTLAPSVIIPATKELIVQGKQFLFFMKDSNYLHHLC